MFAQDDFVGRGVGRLEAVSGRDHHLFREEGAAALEEKPLPAVGLCHVDLNLPGKLSRIRFFSS